MWLLVLIALAYLALLAVILSVENRIIFLPDRHYRTTPRDAGVPHEDVWLTTSDGVRVHAWYLPAERSRGTVLFLHGNAGNISDRLENGVLLTRLGLDVLLLDYRGYGESEGAPTEAGVYRDADAAYDWLLARPGMLAPRLIVFGRSLGAGPAVELAARRPCGALASESAFRSTRALARELMPYALFAPFIPDRFSNEANIRKVKCPVLVLHGTADELIPYAHGRAVFAAAPEPKRFFEIRDAHHNDWYQRDPQSYFAEWEAFLSAAGFGTHEPAKRSGAAVSAGS